MDWTRCVALGIVAWSLAIGVACTNSGLGGTDDTDTAADTDTDTTPNPTGGACPWEGTWDLTEAACGSFVIGNWEQTYTSVTMKASEGDGGGCELVVDWSGPDCGESEVFTVSPAAGGGTTEFVGEGITSCETDGCTFDNDTQGCAPGDRAEATSVTVDDSTTGTLVFLGFGAHAWSTCTLDFKTTWTKK